MVAVVMAQLGALHPTGQQVPVDSGRQWTEGDTGSGGVTVCNREEPWPGCGRPRQGIEDREQPSSQRRVWMGWVGSGCLGASTLGGSPVLGVRVPVMGRE